MKLCGGKLCACFGHSIIPNMLPIFVGDLKVKLINTKLMMKFKKWTKNSAIEIIIQELQCNNELEVETNKTKNGKYLIEII